MQLLYVIMWILFHILMFLFIVCYSYIYIYIYIFSIFIVIFELIFSFKITTVGGGTWSVLLGSQSKLDSTDFILETIAFMFNSMSPF